MKTKTLSRKSMSASQSGAMLVEVMVSVLIFAFGILGIVGLQAASVAQVSDAKYRSDASLLANQVIAQMWVTDKTNATLTACFNGPAASGVCPTAGTMDYPTWANSVAQTLPGATGAAAPTISIDANNNATINVFWQAPNDQAQHNYTTVASIND